MIGSLLAAAAVAVSFQMVSAPIDAPKAPSFALQGYVSDSDHTLLDSPQFVPTGIVPRPSAYVSFESPLDGTCGVAMWETIAGKTTLEMRRVAEMRQGERKFFHVTLPVKEDLSSTGWATLPLDHYGIAVICAITEGPGKGPQSMVESNFYVATVPPTS